MKQILFTLSFILLLGSSLLAQHKSIFTDLSRKSSNGGEIHIYQDADVQVLLNDYISAKKKEKGMQGYRVQIFFGSGHSARENANNIRNTFVSTYKDIPVHVVFEEPNFKVTVGDFRTKSEALDVLVKIKPTYQGAYIVKDFIEYPDLD